MMINADRLLRIIEDRPQNGSATSDAVSYSMIKKEIVEYLALGYLVMNEAERLDFARSYPGVSELVESASREFQGEMLRDAPKGKAEARKEKAQEEPDQERRQKRTA